MLLLFVQGWKAPSNVKDSTPAAPVHEDNEWGITLTSASVETSDAAPAGSKGVHYEYDTAATVCSILRSALFVCLCVCFLTQSVAAQDKIAHRRSECKRGR